MSDPFAGLNPQFAQSLQAMFAAAPGTLTIASGYRSPERQAVLYQQAIDKYGSPEAARKWVAPPGNSMHNRGEAVDLGYGGAGLGKGDTNLIDWVHSHAGDYGLTFPLSNENWHIEPMNARAGPLRPASTNQVADASAPPTMPAMPGNAPQPRSWLDFMPAPGQVGPNLPSDPLARLMQGQNPLGDNPLRTMMFKGLSHLFSPLMA